MSVSINCTAKDFDHEPTGMVVCVALMRSGKRQYVSQDYHQNHRQKFIASPTHFMFNDVHI